MNRITLCVSAALLTALVTAAAAVPFTAPSPNRVELVQQPPVEANTGGISYSSEIDHRRGYLYTATTGASNIVVKSRLATTTSPLTVVGGLTLDPADGPPFDVHLDAEGGFGIVLCQPAGPTRIVKFALDANDGPPARLDHLDLQPGEDSFITGDYDPVNRYLYVIRYAVSPITVAKIATGTASTPMSRTAVATFDPADLSGGGLAVDPASGRGWAVGSSRIVQFLLGAGPAPPSRELHTDVIFGSAFLVEFNPMTRQVYHGFLGLNFLGSVDVSGPAPVAQGLLIDLAGFGRPALDTASGLMFTGMANGTQGMMKHAIGNRSLPGRLPGPSAPVVDFLFYGAAYDPVRGFAYGAGVGVANLPIVPFRQAPAPGPDLNGYINKLGVKASSAKSNVKAQLYLFNTGTADGANVVVRTFLSSDERLSYDDVELGKPRRVKKLSPGKVRKLGAGGAISADVTGKFLIVVIDGEKNSGDGNYGDNVFVSRRL